MKNLALFDLDGTLYRGNSTFEFIAFVKGNDTEFQAFKRRYRYMRIVNKLCRAFFRYDWYKRRSVRFLKGYRQEEIAVLAVEFYTQHMSKQKNTLLHDFLECSQQKGVTIGLLTATIDPIASVVANDLNAHLSFCTELIYVNGIASGEYSEDLLHSKRSLYREHIASNFENVYFFSDNAQDMSLIKEVTIGFRVYGDL